MKKVLVIGAGGRGLTYAKHMAALKEDYRIIAVAEPDDGRRTYMQKAYGIDEQMCHLSWEEFLSRPKFADLAVIATMDQDHFAPAMAAIEKGYDLLLEKPMGATPEECVAIARAAKEKGVLVLVCHVLRFSPYFRALKSLIDQGRVGRIMHIHADECVGNLHQSHSFVRGNWGNSDRSTPMIVQKTCHDMDMLQWLIGKDCTRVHSFGELTYFTKDNMPKGATERCTDGCPHADTCYYNAAKLYHGEKDGFSQSFIRSAVGTPTAPNTEEVDRMLQESNFGRCVFRCDNNVVDHQSVNLEFAGGETVSFCMSAFNKGGRHIHIMGTDGTITGTSSDDFVTVYGFQTRTSETVNIRDAITDDSIDSGHGGGDYGIVCALRDRLNGKMDNVSICTIDETCRNHLIAYAAEESRLTGKVINMKEFERQAGGLD